MTQQITRAFSHVSELTVKSHLENYSSGLPSHYFDHIVSDSAREMKNLGRICLRVVFIEFAAFKPRPTMPKSLLVPVLSVPSSLASRFLSALLACNVY